MTLNAAGVIFWAPTANQFGTNPVELRVDDGQGGVSVQAFNVEVTSQGSNEPPVILSTPGLTGTVDQPYEYDLVPIDPEGDPIGWKLEDAPVGMSINARFGTILLFR